MGYRRREECFVAGESDDMTCEEDQLIAEVLGEPLPAEECPTSDANSNEVDVAPMAPAPVSALKRLQALPLRAFRTTH
jgi:hypothetical protein